MTAAAGEAGAHGTAPVPVRDAATVVLLRDGAAGLEVWQLVRVRQLAFAGGMAVFPGGRVDPADGHLPLAGTAPVELAAARFGHPVPRARAVLGAALRELFEETGVLLAVPRSAVGGGGAAAPAGLAGAREAVESGRQDFGALLEQHDLLLDAGGLVPWSRWVTPEGEVRRYDTHFFVAALPDGAVPADVTTESATAGWTGVGAAIEQAQRGERAMLPPTLVTLAQLSRHADTDAVLAAARADTAPLHPVRPDLQVLPDGRVAAVLPDGTVLPVPGQAPGGAPAGG